MKKSLFLLTVAILLNSCTQRINYKMTDIPIESENDLKNFSLSIHITEDLRMQESPQKKWIFSEDFKNKSTCFNLEKAYGDVSVPHEIEQIISEHIKTKQFFKKVFINQPDSADFLINMQLKSFVGKTEVNPKAQTASAVGSQFGLIGGLVAAAAISEMKSELAYWIEYVQVVIHDKVKNVDLPQFVYSSIDSAEIPAITNCNQVYMQLNNKLKSHNEDFSKLLAQKLLAYLTGKEIGVEQISE